MLYQYSIQVYIIVRCAPIMNGSIINLVTISEKFYRLRRKLELHILYKYHHNVNILAKTLSISIKSMSYLIKREKL